MNSRSGLLMMCMAAAMVMGSGCASMHARNVRKGLDDERVYDRIATDVAFSRSAGSVIGLVVFGSGGGLGGAGADAGASSTSQRTLTVVIKFDADKRVRDFAYHASRF